jgi:hypothetical protein
MENISPEEKLLRLIRGQKKTVPKTGPLKTASGNLATSLQSGNKNQRVQSRVFSFIPQLLTVFYLKRALWLILGLSFCYLIYSFVSPILPITKDRLFYIEPDKVLSPEIERLTELKPLESYLADVKERRIFGGISLSQARPEEIPITSEATDAINNLSLVGIISGENPQAIIEDKAAHKTYYLSKGQSIRDFQVQDIKEGKVTLIIEGQKFELYL